tara:strand:- start:888 stop:1493 length:606 start_codon:yes stop_codon:yes gene_type:complete
MKLYNNIDEIEVGLDECARGVLFGRIYAASVMWPSYDINNELVSQIKDSKKLSRKKREVLYDFIIQNCIDYSISWEDEKEIDKTNILKADIKCFHNCLDKLKTKPTKILVDGNYFIEYKDIPYELIIKGDNKFISIAAASILAKVAHDRYINEICKQDPDLKKYDLENNMGYGTKKHIEAIKKYGISKYHRKTFGICKNYK